jgi:hypothetical protein
LKDITALFAYPACSDSAVPYFVPPYWTLVWVVASYVQVEFVYKKLFKHDSAILFYWEQVNGWS